VTGPAFARMSAGDLYDPGETDLVSLRKTAQRILRDYNTTVYGDDERRADLLCQLLGDWNGAVIRPPFYVDYGRNVFFRPGVFLNYGCVILDVCPVHIGESSQIGPYVQILTADHPRDPEARANRLESGAPIAIGRNVWIGGGAILLPGITVGDDAIIGAGAVVTRGVAPGVTVGGNPARPLRQLH